MRIKSYLILSAITLGITVSSCKKAMDLDINVNPNSPVSAPLDLLLTSAELTTPGIFNGMSNTTLGFVGILANQGSGCLCYQQQFLQWNLEFFLHWWYERLTKYLRQNCCRSKSSF